MGTLNSVIKDRYGKHFKIQHPRESKIELTLTPEFFWNENSAKQFISNSTVANSYWRDIIQQYSNLPSPSSLSVNGVEKHICTLLIQGQLQIFPIDVPDVSEHPPENRAIKASDNVTYLFAPVETLLTTTPKEVKKFTKQEDADKFLSELSADKKKLKILSSELNIDLPQTSSVNSGEILESISKALFLGTTIVIVDRFTGTPPKKEIVESAREADKPVPLAPETIETLVELKDEDGNPVANVQYKILYEDGEIAEGTVGSDGTAAMDVKKNKSFQIFFPNTAQKENITVS